MQLDFPSAAILSKRKKINAPFLHFLKVALHSHMRQNMLEKDIFTVKTDLKTTLLQKDVPK
jgi:hypothetical protein